MKLPRWIRTTVTGAVLLAIFAAGLWIGLKRQAAQQPQLVQLDATVTLLGEPRPLEPFRLVNHRGEAFGEDALRGKWTMMFFGYTHCPDICPTTLVTMQAVKARLAARGAGVPPVQFVFVTVDPQRDTAERLASYVTYYDKEFVGVTGEPEQIASLARNVGAAYEVSPSKDPARYIVNHSAAVFLVDPQARFHALFKPPLFPGQLVSRLEMIQAR